MESSSSSKENKNNFKKDLKKDISHNLKDNLKNEVTNELNTVRRLEIRAEKLYRQSLAARAGGHLDGATVMQTEKDILKYEGDLETLMNQLLKCQLTKQVDLPPVKENINIKKIQQDRHEVRNIFATSDKFCEGSHFVLERLFENRLSLLFRPNCSQLAVICHPSEREAFDQITSGKISSKVTTLANKCEHDKNNSGFLRNFDNLQLDRNTVLMSNNNRRNEILNGVIQMMPHIKEKGSVLVSFEDKFSAENVTLCDKQSLKVEGVRLVALLNVMPDGNTTISRKEKLKRMRRRMRRRAEDKRLAYDDNSSDEY